MRHLSFLAFVAVMTISAMKAQTTEVIYLSGTDKDHTVDWDFYCTSGRNSGVWTKIPVPSNWELQGFGAYNYGLDQNKADEKGQYKYRFDVPAQWRDRRIFIVFEGSMTDTEVWINGRPAGPVHQGGFYRFKYDITKLVDCGAPNLLSVTVSKQSADPTVNAAERTCDYWVFGGIYRPVYLEACPVEYIRRVAINARTDGTLSANVYVGGRVGADRVVGQVKTLEGKAVGEPFETIMEPDQNMVRIWSKLVGQRPWTAETPNLYELEVRLRAHRTDLHVVKEKFGFRTVEMRPGQGVFINGRPIKLKGVNRHSFWPDSGRTTSREVSVMDVNLIKDMNMNAVRMSHYPPDDHFLETCDALGLYVLDELAGWQHQYSTEVGEKLVEELVTRDVNHPSVIIWDNGNEGGWNTDLDDDFAKYDPQKRYVIHPWERFNYTNTAHYRQYNCCPGTFFNGDEVFFPTEFLHGLYDGGAGAALEDYWNLILSKPLGAGGFLWALLDEAVKRTDRDGVLDADGNHGPDGILGPYREKEGSYFAIKEIWSPVSIKMTELPVDFSGDIEVENRFDFTTLNECRFSFRLVRFPLPGEMSAGYKTVYEGPVTAPTLSPWMTGKLFLTLPADWRSHDALMLTARSPQGREIYTWTWMIQAPQTIAARVTAKPAGRPVVTQEDETTVTMKSGDVEVKIAKATGMLASIKGYSLTNGPVLASGAAMLTDVKQSQDGWDSVVEAHYRGSMRTVRWRLQSNGWLRLDYEYELNGDYPFLGVNFDYPEDKIKGMRWLGRGPYRVWKNRLRGGTFNVWVKAYNDTRTGESWLYPEFKGYHSDTYWAALDTAEGPLTIVTEDQGLFLRMLTPQFGVDPLKAVSEFPAGAISFLQGIAPIGTKFNEPQNLGPQGEPNRASGVYRGTVYFYFGRLPAAS
jgi:hypothetical protein